jgi:HAD superfamily hydrolase (TIGR01662 family)
MDNRTFVFIDRDGTMGGPYYVKYPTDYYPYEGTPEAFQLLKENGYPAVIITNQSCIARGLDGGCDGLSVRMIRMITAGAVSLSLAYSSKLWRSTIWTCLSAI